MSLVTSRRSLFGFGAALIAAPAIVRVASLMALSAPRQAFCFVGTLPAYNMGAHALIVSESWWKIVMEDGMAGAIKSDFIIVPDRLPEHA